MNKLTEIRQRLTLQIDLLFEGDEHQVGDARWSRAARRIALRVADQRGGAQSNLLKMQQTDEQTKPSKLSTGLETQARYAPCRGGTNGVGRHWATAVGPRLQSRTVFLLKVHSFKKCSYDSVTTETSVKTSIVTNIRNTHGFSCNGRTHVKYNVPKRASKRNWQ